MDLHLRGKSALVTGASKGIGEAVAGALAEEGCRLHLAARGKDALEAVAVRLREKHGAEVTVHAVDLRQETDVEQLAAAVPDIDLLVNNAGDIPAGSLADVDSRTWRQAWDLKVYGYIDLTRLVYARMRTRGHGVIVNNIGTGGERPDFDYIAGGAGNAALMAFTRALGGRSLRDGIRVVGVNPGPVATERIATMMNQSDALRERMTAYPSGRPAEPREIADTVAFLASDRSSYTSGVIVTVDGGLCAAN
jgi:NAD(P)-dependent dehydrogenase (short-subunit alcohol dehydrogenase family)